MAEKTNLTAQRTELLIGVGECLDSWSAVEFEIANLYMILHGIKRDEFSHPIRGAYEAVISLEVRLAMIEAYALADPCIGSEYPQHLKILKAKIIKFYKKRHEVAHFTTVGRTEGTKTLYFIRPYFTWSKFVSNEGTELSAKQLAERAEKFSELRRQIQRHVQHVGALRKLPVSYYALPGELAFPPLGPGDLNPAVPSKQLLPSGE